MAVLKWLTSIIGDSNEKQVKKLEPFVDEINELEPEFQQLDDTGLRAKTDEFRARLEDGEELDDLLPESFAAVRESARRAIGQRHFDVQLMGGIILHEGKIAEMKTGEGKTLVATLPAYLNALTGKGVHIVTVNDYLAKRDPQWMGPIFHRLGLSVASIQHESSYLFDPAYEPEDARFRHLVPISRREAYQADITYGTNNEFGFDYLRDNMVVDLSQCSQRPLHYAIVDEVDNILIDEARTPLIISGAAEESTDKYYLFAKLVPRLHKGEDFTIEERERTVHLTESGVAKMERWLGLPNLYDPTNYELTHYLDNALKAQVLFKLDRDYVVKDGEVVIVDEFTGRLMFGRRYSEGLHQAIEAKEGVRIQRESVTLATITFQNYFRMYEKLAGMTGTAVTEAEEFHKIYKLDVVVMPTHRPMVRQDLGDQIYKSEEGKFRSVVRDIKELHAKGRPVLVGTVSIEKSERLSDMLMREGIQHQVLNAKFHEKEATIVADAGQRGAVTIATNMAGRGTDIVLGPGVADLGGLHIVGTERHEARRIDNQLRGRSGRQGDPGSSRFYVSLEDDIMRRFGGDRIKGFMEWAGLDDETPIEHSLVSRSIENAQQKVEAYNFDLRKNVVEYDDVMNKHREVIYAERRKILSGADLRTNVLEMIHGEIDALLQSTVPDTNEDSWDLLALIEGLQSILPVPEDVTEEALSRLSKAEIDDLVHGVADHVYEAREAELGPENMRILERLVMLRIIDNLWIEHLTTMDDMRLGIGLRAYGQLDPLVVFKREGHQAYMNLRERIRTGIARTIYHVTITREAPPEAPRPIGTNRDANAGSAKPASNRTDPARVGSKVGRNDPCPCGSGKKYKKCHGRATA
ncbi:MAG: preprotein translocase subunit SecA [Chloroflexota bacterium]|nr:MAG: preprotein translocase subunit SecA [Chloroflexota bacterium]